MPLWILLYVNIGICVENKTRQNSCVAQNINDKPVEVGARWVEMFRPEMY